MTENGKQVKILHRDATVFGSCHQSGTVCLFAATLRNLELAQLLRLIPSAASFAAGVYFYDIL